jgi:hypothetical protein
MARDQSLPAAGWNPDTYIRQVWKLGNIVVYPIGAVIEGGSGRHLPNFQKIALELREAFLLVIAERQHISSPLSHKESA